MKALKQFDIQNTVDTFDVFISLNMIFLNFITYKEVKYKYIYCVHDYIIRFSYKTIKKKITSKEKNHNVRVSISDRIHTARYQ